MRLAALFAIVLGFAACHEPLSPSAASVNPGNLEPRSNIMDGAHHGGNSHFFLLPPLVPAPRYAGVSDPDQSPTVVVCEWKTDDGGSCGAVIASFGRGDGSGGLSEIRYRAEGGFYSVYWNTKQCIDGPCTLDPAKTYRLRVLVGAYELGHADVLVARTATQALDVLKNVLTGEYVGLVDGIFLPINFRIEKGALSVVAAGTSASVGAAGGVIVTDDWMTSLDIPAGALAAEKAITVKPVTDAMPSVGAWATPVDLGPNGTTFDQPVRLTLGFDASKLPQGVPSNAVAIYTWQDGSWDRVDGSVVNEADNTVTAPIRHFSTYAVLISPNLMSGRPPNALFVGDVAPLTGFTVVYDVRADRYCRTVKVKKRFLFWSKWVWATECYIVYTPYQYYPAGQRVYWEARPAPGFVTPAIVILPPVYTVIGANGETISPLLKGNAVGVSRVSAKFLFSLCLFGCIDIPIEQWAANINVIPRPVASVVIAPATATLTLESPGNTQQLTVTVKDANGVVLTDRTVTWVSSDESVAKVDGSGLVTSVGAGSATITATSESVSATAAITVTGGGYTLAFSAMPLAGGTRNVFTQVSGAADATRVRITTGPVDDQSPRWSPNAQRFLFTSSRAGGGTWELYAQDANAAATPRRISTAGGLTAYGDFSPTDPSTAVFMRGYRIWTMNVDAPNPEATAVQLRSSPYDEGYPRWSPDGKWIAFARQPRAGTDIWVLNIADPEHPFQVTDLGDYARSPSWSPDGTRIVFSRLYDIYVADVMDKSNPANPTVRPLASVRITRLTFDGDYNDGPVWSPDGRKIAWSKGGAQHDLYLMNVDGTGVERITSTPDIHEDWPAFKPR